ncbi:hypothetical protein [Nostoc sp.]
MSSFECRWQQVVIATSTVNNFRNGGAIAPTQFLEETEATQKSPVVS